MKKVFAGFLALIMAVCCFPITASAAPQDVIDDYFSGGIAKPKTPYIHYVYDDIWDVMNIWFDKNDDFDRISTDCLKNPEGFYAKYGLEYCQITVQIDAKIDNSAWLSTTNWADDYDGRGWDEFDYGNWGNNQLFNNYVNSSPDWFNAKTFNTNLMYAYAYDFDAPDNNLIFKGTVNRIQTGEYDYIHHFDTVNHTFAFRYRLAFNAQSSEDYNWSDPIFSEWSDVVSIGKNGTQQDLTKNNNPEAPVLSNFTVKNSGTDTKPTNDYNMFFTVPDSVYQDEKYYIIMENGFQPVVIESQYRVNGGKWVDTYLGNDASMYSGYRGPSVGPVKKGDKIEVRSRFREGINDVFIYSPWSNIVSVNAAVTDYQYKEPAPKPAPAITTLDGDATQEQVEKFITGLKNDNDAKGSSFWKFPAKQAKVTNNSIKMTWNKVNGAKYYLVFGNKCGSANRYVLIGQTYSTNFTHKKLKKGTYYKFLVSAFDANGKHIATSRTMHIVTKGGKYCNFKSVKTKAKKNKVTLAKKGKTFKLGAKSVKESKKLKVRNHRNIRYESSDSKVATVDSSGKITAKKKGTCYVFAYAQNGIFSKIKVTVKK